MSRAERSEVLRALDSEIRYQDDRWGLPVERTLDEWALYIRDYAEELAHQCTRGEEGSALETLRKVAAMGFRAMEQHGALRRRDY